MTCHDVGSTNPDIAGSGIVILFAFQAGLSLVLSLWSLSLWGSAHSSWITVIGPLLLEPTLDGFNLRGLLQLAASIKSPDGKARRLLKIFIPGLAGQPIEDQGDDATSPSSWVEGVRWACKKRAIDKVLATISDLQIMNALAILLAALIQHQSMSLYHLHIVYDTASFTG
ncbi:hypothetical protein BKA59DRAFT_69474 [Fusarium tricinctum]|uniref:Uncharacterized protein n=1 Tax=Fusarium tricinctum TaxID=61284 RepID=A0A8K0WFF3_9HYPO|nr:hypothetical protein BKA59DRAFT_69474 [Fusarium tricinctum]